ncbi:MAG TPA: hypothetical protein VF538_04295 [Pyrinomonadaceae bacterium]|jgi:hypothetical protein
MHGFIKEERNGAEEFEANRPALPAHFIANDNQKAVITTLIPLWFAVFMVSSASPAVRIKEYEIHKIEVGEWEGERFIASVKFSVKPDRSSFRVWWVGNEKRNWDWVRDKVLLFTVVKEKDHYRVESVNPKKEG